MPVVRKWVGVELTELDLIDREGMQNNCTCSEFVTNQWENCEWCQRYVEHSCQDEIHRQWAIQCPSLHLNKEGEIQWDDWVNETFHDYPIVAVDMGNEGIVYFVYTTLFQTCSILDVERFRTTMVKAGLINANHIETIIS